MLSVRMGCRSPEQTQTISLSHRTPPLPRSQPRLGSLRTLRIWSGIQHLWRRGSIAHVAGIPTQRLRLVGSQGSSRCPPSERRCLACAPMEETGERTMQKQAGIIIYRPETLWELHDADGEIVAYYETA